MRAQLERSPDSAAADVRDRAFARLRNKLPTAIKRTEIADRQVQARRTARSSGSAVSSDTRSRAVTDFANTASSCRVCRACQRRLTVCDLRRTRRVRRACIWINPGRLAARGLTPQATIARTCPSRQMLGTVRGAGGPRLGSQRGVLGGGADRPVVQLRFEADAYRQTERPMRDGLAYPVRIP